MAWAGYFEYDGTEIINSSRVEAYAPAHGLSWFKPVYRNRALGPMLGETYSSPMIDDAPWFDEDDPASAQFMGVYPIDVTGIENSTITATVVESLLDGGVVQRPRRATRAIVFAAVLVGVSDCGVEYGMRWLRTVMSGNPCGVQEDCTGGSLCYMSCEPAVPVESVDPTTCLDPYMRSLHAVSVTTGPIVTAKYEPSNGVAWLVTWTMIAGQPYEFMMEKPLVDGFTDASEDFYVNPAYPPEDPDFAWADSNATEHTDAVCITPTYRPLTDPNCPILLAPPPVPQVAVSCFEFPETYDRRFFIIPKEEVTLYGSVVPILTIRTVAEIRSFRVRFYTDVFDTHDPDQDACSYCGDMVFSYIPAGAQVVLDGVRRQVYVDTPGQPRRRADALVFDSNGRPFEWPELSCGFAYTVTLDQPSTYTVPTVDLTLVGKVF